MRTSFFGTLKRAFRFLVPSLPVFLLGLFFVAFGIYGFFSPGEPAALEDLTKTTVFATKMLYRSNSHGSNYWELETRTALRETVLYRIEPQAGCGELKARIDSAPRTVPFSEDGETDAFPVKGVYADIWVEPRYVFGILVSRHVVQAEIDGERIISYTPQNDETARRDTVRGLIIFLSLGLCLILLPIVKNLRARKSG